MQEKTEELYQEYLDNVFDIIFDENNELSNSYPNNVHVYCPTKYDEEGYEIIRTNKGKNFIDKKGRLLSDTWYDDAYSFDDGCALVHYNGRYNFVNTSGKLLSDTGYDNAFCFSCGCARVKKNRKYLFIDTNGKPLNDELYDDADSFSCGYAKVEKDGNGHFHGKGNFIDTKGKLLSDEWYDFVMSFVDGIALVHMNGKYNIIDTNGKLLSDTGYDEVDIFEGGCAAIKVDGKYNIVNTKGELLSNIWFNKIFSMKYGSAVVIGNQGYNLININGKLLSNKWFDEIKGYDENYLYVRIGDTYNFINRQGELLSDTWYTCGKDHYSIVNDSFYKISPKEKFEKNTSIKCFKKYLNGYQIKKIITGYQCISASNVFKVKYEPIAIYGSRYILCLNNENVVLFDKKSNAYKVLGTIEEVNYNENFIFDRNNKKVLFMYHDNIIDITDYYARKLRDRQTINVVEGVNILSQNDFFFHKEDEIREMLKKEREEHIRVQHIEEEKEVQQKLEKTKELDEVEKGEIKVEQIEILKNIKLLLSKLAVLQAKSSSHERICVNNLFVVVGDHKEINPLYVDLGMLKYIDLKGETFENVKVDGIDFRGCNIILNPQRVYNKNLSNCNFEGLHIDAWMDFRDVDIRGAKFSQDNDANTIDGQNMFFVEAIYDATTTYNGIPFDIAYGECKKTKEIDDLTSNKK